MLRPPYSKYERLFVYYLEGTDLPENRDPDLLGSWEEDGTTLYFFHCDKEGEIARLCREKGSRVVYQADLDYKDWEAGVEITSFQTGGLTVAPAWDSSPAQIRIDPSIIFGSGFHPTTRMCLEYLLDLQAALGGEPRTIVDLGTGTGLLAIAAAFGNQNTVLAVDQNSMACTVAQENISRNGVGNRVTVARMDLRQHCPDLCFDIVIANLYGSLLRELFQNPAFWRGKRYIISGFIPAMEPELLAALPPGIQFLERRRQSQWCLWGLWCA